MLVFTNEMTRFKMGRGHDSEVRVNDISVSRCHAVINYRSGGIYIADNRSKFGTLVLSRNNEVCLETNGKHEVFQIGRSVCSFKVETMCLLQHLSQRDNQPTMDEEVAMTSSEASQQDEPQQHLHHEPLLVDNYAEAHPEQLLWANDLNE